MDEKTLRKYIKAFRRGDESAFDALYDATKTPVYYTILAIVKDESLTEDLMQDTYLKMIKEIDQYTDKGSFVAWLRTIAKNTALNAYKRRSREVDYDIQEGGESIFGQTEDSQEKRYEVEQLLRHLREDEREIIIRHAVMDETHRSIAESMDKPLGTVLWTYRNALKKLKRMGGDPHAKTQD
ncbi:MAG: RNA polymerase sigma factor [Candidatus Izemoplasmataceae bacterium]